MEKDNVSHQKKLGQILVEDGQINDSDIEKALCLQEKNQEYQLLGVILLKMNLITKAELSAALNKQIEKSGNDEKSGVDVSDDEGVKIIVEKYKETEYFNDLHELMAIVTHKVRNPLAGISAAAEVLKERTGNDSANEKFFEMIFKEVDRLENLVKDLFKAFSKK
ncbi:signal transduction histidine kinase [Candidatus Scalindua japonica]|uniref:histidine kinase n=1 Tax=Candidatus Scalindua japonica TaxID=1284222 RepID=A0A286TW06_9BACT|nr:histidine kinase dimerization/phospho-acceptor domain-containing protein [Candidatus Scalindua japonica]GAX60059.1 signal transduction histidine kinase [Candidatus Scalindua japonica]